MDASARIANRDEGEKSGNYYIQGGSTPQRA